MEEIHILAALRTIGIGLNSANKSAPVTGLVVILFILAGCGNISYGACTGRLYYVDPPPRYRRKPEP